MKNKIILYVVILIVIFGAIYFALNDRDSRNTELSPKPEPKGQLEGTVVSPEQNKDVILPSYSLSEVATHNSASSCWTIVHSNVYDLTAWISKHPGGANAILSMCGKNSTAAFEQVHGGKEKQENTLAGFEIGTYKQ